MPEYTIRPMAASELELFFKRITQDFPVGEYPPYEILSRQLGQGLQDGLVFRCGEQNRAYAFCAASTDYVLLSLFAVLPQHRGQGTGSAFLRALQNKYVDRRAMIGEVERPELAANIAEARLRRQRIEFYEQAGYYLIPAIDYTIWDVPMHLMALPLTAARETIDANIQTIMYQIYLPLMGQQFMHKLKFK